MEEPSNELGVGHPVIAIGILQGENKNKTQLNNVEQLFKQSSHDLVDLIDLVSSKLSD